MTDILSYVSTKVKDGKEFDTLVGNLLYYKPETLGYIEQDYNSIGKDFSTDSNSLYNLPAGNYRLENLPESPFDADFVNISIYQKNNSKIITCDIGGNDKYFAEVYNAQSDIVWEDANAISSKDSAILYIGDRAPSDSTMVWIDTSNLDKSSDSWAEICVLDAKLQSVCYGNGKFVVISAIDGNSNTFLYSIDGKKWEETNDGISSRIWRSVCYGDNKFIAISWDNIFAYSVDGIAWVEVSIGSARSWESICFGNGKYIAIAYDSNVFAYSVNGLTWAEVTIGASNQNWISVCYGNGKYVAVSESNNVFAYSTDGIAWSSGTISAADRHWYSVCYGNGKFVVVGNDSFVAYSTDGIAWIEMSISTIPQKIISVCYGENEYLSVAYGSNKLFSSPNGILWEEKKMTNNVREWTAVCYGDNKYITVSNNGIVASSEGYSNMVSLRYFNEDTSTWISCSIIDNMLQNIYDVNNEKRDPYSAIAETLDVLVNESIDKVYAHSNNSDIHLTSREREIIDIIMTKNSIDTLFTEDGELYNSILESLNNKIHEELNYSESSDAIRDASTNLENHLSNHISQDMVDRWNSKSDADHEHLNDNSVKITFQNISGIFDKEQLSFDVQEKIYQVNSEIELNSIRKDPYHNGDKFYIESANGCEVYILSDMEYLGIPNIHGIDSPWSLSHINNASISRQWRSICYGNDKFVVVASNSDVFAYSYDGIDWNEGIISDTKNDWYSVCYGNGIFVAVAWNSTVFAYSYDGITWTEVTISDTERSWWSICYGNDKFVAVSLYPIVFAHSTDGITWTEGTISDTERDWWSICYGNGMFVAVARYSTVFAYSYDGITWTEGTISDTSMDWQSVCYGNDKFVAISWKSNIFAYSYDGITWTEGTISDTERDWWSICYGNGMFVAISWKSNIFAYSTDGIDWTEGTISDTERDWWSICYGNDKFVVVAYELDVTGYALFTEVLSKAFTKLVSADLNILWDRIKDAPTTVQAYGITDAVIAEEVSAAKDVLHYTYTPEEYKIENIGTADVYVGIQRTVFSDGGGTEAYPMSTAHAELDVILAVDPVLEPNSVSTVCKCNCEAEKCLYVERWTTNSIREDNWRSVCYGNGMFVAIGYDSNMIVYSTDGIKWMESTISDTNRYWTSVCYGNGMFVAIGYDSNIFAYSTNGKDWEERTVGSTDGSHWRSICYGNGKFLAVGSETYTTYESNAVKYSKDCNMWTRVSVGDTDRYWESVCYGNGMFVVVGLYNIFDYSTDGTNWTEVTISDTIRDWRSICYGNGMFVAVADDSNIFAYSYNGIDWTEGTISDTNRNWRSICYGKDNFIAVSSTENIVAYSVNGLDWTEDTIPDPSQNWRSICYGNGMFVAVADDSNIFASLIDYIGMPKCKAVGLSLIPCTCSAHKYFSNTYDIDDDNPKWNTDGLGRMIKIDTTKPNTVINEKYIVNDHEYDVKLQWNPNIGVIFDVGVIEAVETCQSIHDNMCAHIEGVQSAITLYDKLFTDNGWK